MRRRERKGRRKRGLPEGFCLGHTVKSRMTVISRWSAIVSLRPVYPAHDILKYGTPVI
ncbi:MAG: hypothetical protein K1W30_08405 [Lachnospiraceae bacterium]